MAHDMMFDVRDKRILVTGASSGLGRHFCHVFASAGAHVIAAARTMAALEELAAEIAAKGGRAQCLALDVNHSPSIRAALDQAGSIDVLVNNAGLTNTKPVLDQTEDDFDRILGTNLRGGFLMATEAARRMRDNGGGAIIDIASILGLRQGGQVTPMRYQRPRSCG